MASTGAKDSGHLGRVWLKALAYAALLTESHACSTLSDPDIAYQQVYSIDIGTALVICAGRTQYDHHIATAPAVRTLVRDDNISSMLPRCRLSYWSHSAVSMNLHRASYGMCSRSIGDSVPLDCQTRMSHMLAMYLQRCRLFMFTLPRFWQPAMLVTVRLLLKFSAIP